MIARSASRLLSMFGKLSLYDGMEAQDLTA